MVLIRGSPLSVCLYLTPVRYICTRVPTRPSTREFSRSPRGPRHSPRFPSTPFAIAALLTAARVLHSSSSMSSRRNRCILSLSLSLWFTRLYYANSKQYYNQYFRTTIVSPDNRIHRGYFSCFIERAREYYYPAYTYTTRDTLYTNNDSMKRI